MRQKISKLAVAMSLVLCVATAALWVRSYQHLPRNLELRYQAANENRLLCSISSSQGNLGLFWIRWPDHDSPLRSNDGARHDHYVGVPYWLLLLLFAVAPSIRVARGWRRPLKGVCGTCGYDLRATPDRCPECGAVPRELPHNPTMQRTGAAV